MAKTAASHVWHKGIKEIGNGYVLAIMRCSDAGAGGIQVGSGMMLAAVDGEMCVFADSAVHLTGVTVAETIVDDDRYFLGKKKGGQILHNQKLAGTYKIADAVYCSATGTWTYAQSGTANSLLGEVGIVVGPADRVTATVLKDIDDAFTATEGVDILV